MIALDTSQSVEFKLPSDADRPDAPTFRAHYLTAREASRVRAAADDAWKAYRGSTGDDAIAIAVDGLAIGLTGWTGAKDRDGADVPFAPDNVRDFLTDLEILELVNSFHNAILVSELDRKKSASPSPSATEPAAPVAT